MSQQTLHLLVKPTEDGPEYHHLTSEDAGWEWLHFGARKMQRGQSWQYQTGNNELGLVILGGHCSVESSCGNWKNIGQRKNVFDGKPYALYLPRNCSFTVVAENDDLDIAYGWCPADEDHPAQLITPEQSPMEIRGGGNATRQINGIIPPGFNCQRLVVVEVYTPSGNWSSYPPHKHDVHRVDAVGNILEADLEEVYFYKMDRPEGYAIQRVYTDDLRLNELVLARDNDLVMVPEGYHPVAAAHGYNVYYLNFLAGSAQSLANADDPQHAWIKETWRDRDPRVPVVS